MKDDANANSGFYGSLSPGHNPALLVVDFQRGFTDPSVSPLASKCDDAVLATDRLIRAARHVGPVFFTVVAYEKNMKDAGVWVEKCGSLSTLLRNTDAVELDPRLSYEPDKDTTISKTQASAFFGTPLHALLAAQRCDTLVIAGCTTSGCVRASTVDAMQHGFRPFVVRDCVADRSQAQHESNLVDIESKYAEVVDLQEMLNIFNQIRVRQGSATEGC